MKTKIKRHSRSALSILLTVCMLISCMTVGLIATDAARANSGTVASNGTAVNRTVYVKQSAVSSTTYSDYRVWFAHTDNNLINELITMTDTGKTIGDDKVYSATIYDIYDGLNKIYFQAFDDDSWAAQTKAVDKWTKYSIYNGKVWNGSSWEVPNWDTVYGVTGCTELTGDDWGVTNSENDMTKSGSSYTKTYNDIPAGSYEFKITKDHDWANSVGYSSNVSFSGVAANNESSDGNNIRFTTSVTSNITITFTPANTIVVNAVSNETTYSVTVKSGDGTFTEAGNNTDQTVTAGNYTAATLPEVTPPSGKKFKEWTKTGSVTLNNAESNGSATVNATAAGGTVTATYEDIAVTTIYIAKNDNVKNIYVWDNNGNKIEGDFPGKELDTTIILSTRCCGLDRRIFPIPTWRSFLQLRRNMSPRSSAACVNTDMTKVR